MPLGRLAAAPCGQGRGCRCRNALHRTLPWAAFLGLVLPTSTRTGFAPSCARWPAFQQPRRVPPDELMGGAMRPPASLPGMRGSKQRRVEVLAGGAAGRCVVGERGGELAAAPAGAFARVAHPMSWKRSAEASSAGGSDQSLAASAASCGGQGLGGPIHPAEAGLESLDLPPALAQWVDRLPNDLLAVMDKIEQQGAGRVWLVGGCVRDCLSGLTPWEVDLATTLSPEQVLSLFPRALDTGSEHGTVTVRKGGVSCEVTTLRAAEDGPDHGTSLREDLLQRDLTMNAIAVHVGTKRLFDPSGGQADILNGTLRAVGSAGDRLSEDGLRALRAYRFIDSKVGVREPDTALACALLDAPVLLEGIPRERIWAELRRILAGPRASLVCARMARDGVLRTVLHHDITPDCRGLMALGYLEASDLPLWADKEAGEHPARSPSPGEVPEGRRDVLRQPRAPARTQVFSHLAVTDLEATCDDRRGFSPPELIELPVVLIDCATGRVEAEFHTYVRPQVNPSLTDFCQELTGITQAQVDAAPTFPDAMGMLAEWLETQGFATDAPSALPPDAKGSGAASSPALQAGPAAAAKGAHGEGAAVGEIAAGAAAQEKRLLWVCDGDWDLRSMIPRQCALWYSAHTLTYTHARARSLVGQMWLRCCLATQERLLGASLRSGHATPPAPPTSTRLR